MLKTVWSGWKKFGQWIGDFLARVVLTFFYFSVFLPFGLGVRLLGDPLQIKKRPFDLWLARSTQDRTLEDTRRQS